MAWTPAQQQALAFGPKFSAPLSILGSSLIVWEVLRDRKKLGLVYHRILLGMSIFDILISSAWFLSTWPVPKETQNIYGNVGNQATCNAQGFFIQLKIANPLYNSALSLYYLLVVRYGWKEERLRKQVEPFMHALPFLFAVTTSTASVALGLFNNANLWCWLAAFPSNCYQGNNEHDISQIDLLPTCERGKHAWIFRLAFFYVWYWASFVWITIAMFLVYWTVRQAEESTKKYAASAKPDHDAPSQQSGSNNNGSSGTSTKSRSSKNTARVATQAMLYVGAYFLSALFATLTRVLQAFADKVPYWVLLGMTIFYPMQGLFNYLIYVRPRYIRNRKKGLKGIQAVTMPNKSTKRRKKRKIKFPGRKKNAGAHHGGRKGPSRPKGEGDTTSQFISGITDSFNTTRISQDESYMNGMGAGGAAENNRSDEDQYGEGEDYDDNDYYGDDYRLGCLIQDRSSMFQERSSMFQRSSMSSSFGDGVASPRPSSSYMTTNATGQVVPIQSPGVTPMPPLHDSRFSHAASYSDKASTAVTERQDSSNSDTNHSSDIMAIPEETSEDISGDASGTNQPRISHSDRVREAIRQTLASRGAPHTANVPEFDDESSNGNE